MLIICYMKIQLLTRVIKQVSKKSSFLTPKKHFTNRPENHGFVTRHFNGFFDTLVILLLPVAKLFFISLFKRYDTFLSQTFNQTSSRSLVSFS